MSSSPAISADDAGAVLEVRDLTVRVGDVELVQVAAIDIARGERVGLIGESGSGKSLTALAVLGLLDEGLVPSGSVRLTGVDHDLVGATERQLARVRGRQVAMVFQEPMTALNPTKQIGEQVAEALRLHAAVDRRAARAGAVDLLRQVAIPEPEQAARSYPHQLSGGQRQRVVIAIALANDPPLLVCDEPTTALDVTVQAQVLDVIVSGAQARDAALLFITHDLAVVATVCQRVLVMYGGRVVEAGTVHEVFTRPRHPYTAGLLAASDLDAVEAGGRLATIAGTVPPAGQFPAGCVFRNRCPNAQDDCRVAPPWTGRGADQGFACHHPVAATDVEVVAHG